MTERAASSTMPIETARKRDALPSIAECTARFANGTLSPSSLLDMYLARIDRRNPELNAFACLNADGARREAKDAAARWLKGTPLSPVDGIPITIKDMFDVAGLPSRRGSLATSEAPAKRNAPVVERLRNAGAVLIGLTTTAEFGGAPVTISPLTGVTRNAVDPSRSAGGSSGGAAVSVAAGFCAAALASDTGGSIRIPSAFNGVVGLKPTGGRIPTDPASVLRTLGCPGPIGRSVADCGTMLGVMSDDAYGAFDPSCPALSAGDATTNLPDVTDLRIVASEKLGYGAFIDDEVAKAFEATVQRLRELGCRITMVEPDIEDPLSLFQIFTRANYADWFGDMAESERAKLGQGIRDAVEAGGKLTAVDLVRAGRAREAFAGRLDDALGPYDILLTPTVAVPAFAAEAFAPDHPAVAGNPRAWSAYGYPFNLTGQPALTLPCGHSASGLPIGCQIIAGRWRETLLLHVGGWMERKLDITVPDPIGTATDEVAHVS